MLKNGYAKQMFPDLFKEQVEPKWLRIAAVETAPIESYWSESFTTVEAAQLEMMASQAEALLGGLLGAGIPKDRCEEIVNKAFHKTLNPPMQE